MPKNTKTNTQVLERGHYPTLNVKALLVGINYRGTRNQLGGCINDVLNSKNRILSVYPTANIELLTDDTANKPTRANILDNLKRLVNNCKPGDTLVFHYSGHGSQVQDIHGDAHDGLDETICPIDFMVPRTVRYHGKTFRVDSQILNNEIHEIISVIPKGVKFLMLSDSCHSGTIGDLKNDFHNYHGPNKWGESSSESSNNSPGSPQEHTNNSPQHSESSSSSSNKIFNCYAHWTYARHTMELWVTPLVWDLYKTFGNFKIKIDKKTKLPQELINNGIYKCNSTFEQLNNKQFKIASTELSTDSFIGVPSLSHIDARALAEEAGTIDMFNIVAEVKYNYDSVTGRHIHAGGGVKRSLNMKSLSCNHGGELRVISGCEENETSADTGTNGACTKAFWDTVQYFGGLTTFFPKLFSHNIQDLKDIQDTINLNLHRFGFTQNSVISWEHAHNVPVNPQDATVEVAPANFSYYRYKPYEKQHSHSSKSFLKPKM